MFPAHPIVLSPMAMYGGTIMAVSEALVCVKNTILQLWLGIILFPYEWFFAVHSQYYGPPEVVIPLRVTGIGLSIKTKDWLSYRMHFGGQNQVIHMKVNKHFLSRHFQVFTYSGQGALFKDQPFVKNDCNYYGYVEGDPESLVALSTCLGGLQGILQTNDTVYEIEPKTLSTTFEHFIYKVDSEETQMPPMRCGLTDEEIARQLKFQENVNFTLMQSGYEGWWTHRRLLELAVVVDHNRYLHHQSNTTAVQYEVLLVVNEVDNFLSSLDVDVVLMGIEVWTEKNPIKIDNIVDLLEEFCIWKQTSLNSRIPHDIAHLFVKRSYGITIGIAFIGTVCNFSYNCGVESLMYNNLYTVAYTMIHEIGHNFGMVHDGPTCTCGHKTCVMFQGISGTTRFSNCSYASFINTTASQNCMYISSNTGNIFTLAKCGNGVVEEGEECDCGALHLCIDDPCCESDCTLSPGAACASGLCCKDCQILPTGEVCRQEENDCDLPEWCNGTSYHCPEDVYVQNGVSCKGGGYCYEKRCNNREEQCRNIFGKEAKSANQSCYTEMNTRGDRFGNCGLMKARYVQCNISDTLCGRIQCENVTELPHLRDHSTVHWTHFNGVTCWGTDYHFGMTIPDIGDVKDGTECGAEHVCIQRKCVHRSLLVNDCAPKTCNMSGVCNNRHHCHCNPEWDPPNCLKRGHGGSIDSGPPPGRTVRQKTNYLRLLWSIRFIILLCLLILGFLTRRRTDKSEEQNVAPSHE
ncbi:disintegrin and metalloproteinase domain-containing protein 25-like [Eptesicus fuscus]|uniref:disintegrin and metalloproteinase domain-containing protein 25-like n=1 Tax=Eptesicus fuscus TaxID=29078 RepID=UPI0024041227|nr:disintegrin and metalloproteinase domain-containing protein 25-like [Eptesicus fuscus]XP_054573609.1 disintegrin and metalloproteinase domain-containing protein 25-like [Eptesicus fuscus]XP_054573610.1 disintegrin and metalloproteinase domain-containing protein 25-like [Eptesicus fuscus]